VVKLCFPALIASADGQARLKAMIPTWDVDIKKPENTSFYRVHARRASEVLQLV
jgi:malate dehydrogenase (quinone)